MKEKKKKKKKNNQLGILIKKDVKTESVRKSSTRIILILLRYFLPFLKAKDVNDYP